MIAQRNETKILGDVWSTHLQIRTFLFTASSRGVLQHIGASSRGKQSKISEQFVGTFWDLSIPRMTYRYKQVMCIDRIILFYLLKTVIFFLSEFVIYFMKTQRFFRIDHTLAVKIESHLTIVCKFVVKFIFLLYLYYSFLLLNMLLLFKIRS